MSQRTPKPRTPKSINYPVNVYGDVEHARRMAIDIGGSLTKLVYLVEKTSNGHESATSSLGEESHALGDGLRRSYRMRFVKFETKHIESCLNFIQERFIRDGKAMRSDVLYATGGGAHKYMDLIHNKLGLKVIKEDEIDCTIKGATFLMNHVKDECFSFNLDQNPHCVHVDMVDIHIFPFLLVNIGSGVSIIKVESNDKYERVGGTSLGGGTFWGLGSLLTEAMGFDELLNLAETGDSTNVDMTVRDIYGGGCDSLGLPADLTASSFGKAARASIDKNTYKKEAFLQSDIANSLLRVISYTIGQIAHLYAQVHKLDRIFFGGYFIRGHPVTMRTISFAVNYFSKGQQSSLFFKHEGFLGALGAYTSGVLHDKLAKTRDDASFCQASSTLLPDEAGAIFVENLATTSFESYVVSRNAKNVNIVSLDCATYGAHAFPMLKHKEASILDRDHAHDLITYFEQGINPFLEELRSLYPIQGDLSALSKQFATAFRTRLSALKYSPLIHLETIQSFYDMRDNFIAEYILPDPFLNLKQVQNQEALDLFPTYTHHLDSIVDISQRHTNIFHHLLAGSLVDLGSNEYLKYKHSGECVTHSQAVDMILNGCIHFIGGTVDQWASRFSRKVWKKVAMFVDNSGYDIIFGIIALAREFLQTGCEVILVANTYPSLNDIIHSELVLLSNRIKSLCPILRQAQEQDKLRIFPTGFGSSCLNLSVLGSEVCDHCQKVDLVILEGQSRSLIGNFLTEFSCDSLKIGTVTSSVLAKLHGFQLFDSYLKFQFLP